MDQYKNIQDIDIDADADEDANSNEDGDDDVDVGADENEEENAGRRKYIKKVEESYKTRYGKTKAEIDAENKHILSTQASCLKFVKKYPGHYKVCHYCKQQKAPKIYWKWDY